MTLKPDSWKTRRDTSRDPKREPGPIDLNRYDESTFPAGIPTFMRLPIALNPDDLRAGKVDAAIIGVPLDTSMGQRGAAFGPQAIRTAERYGTSPASEYVNMHVRVKPFEVLRVVDYGDAAVDLWSIDASKETIQALVHEVAETGATPIVLGGDHSILWPDAAAMAEVYGAGKVGVIHFDAHCDCSEQHYGHHATHGTPIRRLIMDEHIPGRNFIQVGLRSNYPDDELLDWMRRQGMRSHFMAEVERYGIERVIERAIDEALDGPEYLYLSFDIDVLDPVYAPGTGTPEPGGFTTREMFPVIRRLCHETHVVGMEVVEVAPAHDPGYITAINASRIIFEALTGLAMRKLGIQGQNYLDPITSGEQTFPIPPAHDNT